jgi:hypothetical protein
MQIFCQQSARYIIFFLEYIVIILYKANCLDSNMINLVFQRAGRIIPAWPLFC